MLKENKFLIGLGTATVLISGGLIYMGMSAGSSLEELQTEISDKSSKLERMQNLDPSPTPENAQAKEDSAKAVLAKAEQVRSAMLGFNPENLDDISGSEFSEKLKAAVARVSELFPGEDALPKDFALGFAKYADYLPPEEATGELAFQLEAIEYLFTELAASGVGEVINIHRAPIPMEDDKDWDGNSTKGRGAGARPKPSRPRPPRGGRGGRGAAAPVLPKIAHAMPVELTFRAPEKQAREFLTRIGDSDKFFFQTRVGRIQNPAPIPSAGKGASSAGGDSGGGDVVFEDDPGDVVFEDDPNGGEGTSAQPTAPVESVPVLTKVSGGEDLNVFLRLDLLYFIDSQSFPQIK